MTRARGSEPLGKLRGVLPAILLLLPGLATVPPLAVTPAVVSPLGANGNATVVGNFSSALGRLVTLVAAGGGALLALVWTRVALSWFSNDVAKKVQAKDRARDALIGTLLFAAAVSGLAWALAQWVVSGA